jgi:hypothetical protein
LRVLFGTLALGLGLAGGATAQVAPAYPDHDPYLIAIDDCFDASETLAPPETVVATCEAALLKLDAVQRSVARPTGHQTNRYRFGRAGAYGFIMGAYNRMDAPLSARLCNAAEQGWAEQRQINEAESPPEFMTLFRGAGRKTLQLLRACRAKNGAPPGAPPLPVIW